MIKHLKVKSILTDFEYTYDTFEEAVDTSTYSERYKRAKEDNKKFRYLKIIDFKIYMNRVAFFLSDGKILEILGTEKHGDWKVLQEESQDEIPQNYAEEVHLEARVFDSDLNIYWRPLELLRSRLGIVGFGIYPSKTMVYLHVRGFEDLLFGHMIDSGGNLRINFNDS